MQDVEAASMSMSAAESIPAVSPEDGRFIFRVQFGQRRWRYLFSERLKRQRYCQPQSRCQCHHQYRHQRPNQSYLYQMRGWMCFIFRVQRNNAAWRFVSERLKRQRYCQPQSRCQCHHQYRHQRPNQSWPYHPRDIIFRVQ